MIAYEDLCRALDQYKTTRRNAQEMQQLEQISEEPVAVEPAPMEVAPVEAAAVNPAYTEPAPMEPAPMEPVSTEQVPQMVDPQQVAAVPQSAGLEMGATDQIFTPGNDMPYTAQPEVDPALMAPPQAEPVAMPFLEEPTDVTPLQPIPAEVEAPGPEETTQEFDIEEAEEVNEKDLPS